MLDLIIHRDIKNALRKLFCTRAFIHLRGIIFPKMSDLTLLMGKKKEADECLPQFYLFNYLGG
ncbi:hypothetical protein D1614_03795 [Maribellus luteus]|uniref:Uncharacterized protein n=1 Tax=Maribellus luteus TaxID=2305463 RepID=A0A399T4N3_9BACT|nr:hypothetical protein D1614_03795 [Maribellus luteus]